MNTALGSIDLTLKPKRLDIYLAKPDKTIIAKLNEAYNIILKIQLSDIDEVSFNLPYKIDIHHRLEDNPNVKKIRERYLLLLKNNVIEEWFIITELEDDVSEEGDIKVVKAFSLAYELADKIIRDYSVTSYNATQVLVDALSTTIWNVGYVDAEFDLKYRSFNVSSETVLTFVNRIAETFNAVILWDTERRRVNLYKPENVGINRGLSFSYGKYLQTLNKALTTDEMATRLKVYGKDNLSIRRVNPTGTNYIEDFSYFMFPFERDENRNVISHSYYMSDSLCHAILDYQDLLEIKEGEFASLLDQKETLEQDLTVKNNELQDLLNDMDMILDSLYVNQTAQLPTDDLEDQKEAKQAEIDAKNDEINQIIADIENIDTSIANLKNELAIENNFTTEQILERNQFIIEKEWSDENYIDEKDLKRDAIEKFKEIRTPKTVINIDVVNFLEVIEEQRNWDKISLGDIVTIKYEYLNILAQAKIISIEFDFDNQKISLEIANTKDINDDSKLISKYLSQSISTSTTVDMNKFKWDGYAVDLGDISSIIQNMYNKVREQLDMSFNDTVIINRRGITIIDPNNPLEFLRATHGCLALTNDGGNTFKHAITPFGIVGERIFGRIITGERVVVGDPDGILEIRGNTGVVTDDQGTEVMWFGMYEQDRFGLKLENDISQVIVDRDNGFQINRLESGNWDNVAWLDTEGILHIRELRIEYMTGIMANNITIDAEEGIVITRGDNRVKTILNTTNGISIQRKESGFWVDKFYALTDGTLYAEDLITKRIKILGDENDIILDAESGFFDMNKLNNIAGNLQAENINTKIIIAESGFINDLTVNHLKTLMNDTTGEVNYIDIEGNKARWITGNITQTGSQAEDVNGDPLYWTDISKTSTTTEVTPYPVYEYSVTELTKLQIYFDENSELDVPIMEFGAGDSDTGNAKGYIMKQSNSFDLKYISVAGLERKIELKDTGIALTALGTGTYITSYVQKQGDVGIFYNNVRHLVATRMIGTANFSSGTTISHGLGHTNYSVWITPTATPNGYLGEVYISKGTTSFTVYRTGSATSSFDWGIVY